MSNQNPSWFYAIILIGFLTCQSLYSFTHIPISNKLPFDACNNINWATWTDFNGNSALGTIDNGGDIINVKMTSNFSFASTPEIYNHSKFSSYPSIIPNRTVPQTEWSVGAGGITTMCFSKTVTNPVLLIASLGASLPISSKLSFSRPYVVLFDGGNMVFHDNTSLTGTEGYAIIMFPGDFDCVTINSNTQEFYTNITWGIRPPPFPINIIETQSCGSTRLTASGGVSYQWSGGTTPNSASNTFTTSGTYIVTVTNAAGCKTSVSKEITVGSTPATATITGTTTGCQKVVLTASGGVSYEWDGGSDPTSATNSFNRSGRYTVTVTNINGCKATASRDVVVANAALGLNWASNTCGPITVTASGGLNYQWDGGLNPNNAVNTFTSSGLYHVSSIDVNGCPISGSVNLVINTPIEPKVSIISVPSGPICSGTPIIFTATAENEGTMPIYTWYKNGIAVGQTPVYRIDDLKNNDEITCELISNIPCAITPKVKSNPIILTVNDIPSINFGSSKTIKSETPVQLSPIVVGDIQSYEWSPSEGLSNPSIRNPIANPASTTTYQLKATSTNGCDAISSIKVTILRELTMPNTFSPNGDGINDIWEIKNFSNYPNSKLSIFNRYGTLIYQSFSDKATWDGKSKGKDLPVATYYYIITLMDKKESVYNGTITIIK